MDQLDLRSVDLFCGAGGLSYGLRQIGFQTRFALDVDEAACRTFNQNVANVARCGNVSNFSADDILNIARASIGELSLVCGGPPCQGFSIQRRGGGVDARNELVQVFVETAVSLKPRAILMENVPTLLGQRGIPYLREIYKMLNRTGYQCKARTLNAADFGVPQVRNRAFLVAWDPMRSDEFFFPEPTHASHSRVNVRDAIGDLPEPPQDLSEHVDFANHVRVNISKINIERISYVPEGGGRKDIPSHLQLPCHLNDNGHRHLDVFGRMYWDRPAPTITAMFDNFTRGRFGHPSQNRCITAREGARLQSFPDSFRFFGGKKDIARQIGNAVPPRLASRIGGALIAALYPTNSTKRATTSQLYLGLRSA